MICNFLALLNQVSTRLFARRGRHQKRRTTLGLLCKIGFERRINFEGEVKKIVGLALFASKPKKTTTTSLCIVVSPLVWELLTEWLGIQGIHPRQ
jgi:hypothetical protein